MECPTGFWCFQFKDLLNAGVLLCTIFAIYYGPIRAVQITRDNDLRNEKRRREFAIYSNLMKTRRMILDPVHVTSLNLVEVEFSKSEDIIRAYRAYIANLSKSIPENQPEHVTKKFLDERDDAFFDLVHAIGTHLGFAFDKRDLHKFSYAPLGWQTTEQEIQSFRRLVIEMLIGRRPLLVKQFHASDVNDKFPPPPAV